jgi:hypothetical protein
MPTGAIEGPVKTWGKPLDRRQGSQAGTRAWPAHCSPPANRWGRQRDAGLCGRSATAQTLTMQGVSPGNLVRFGTGPARLPASGR